MPDEPTRPQGPTGDQPSAPPKQPRGVRQLRLLVLLGVLLVVVAAVLVVVAVVGRGDDSTGGTETTMSDDATLITSPYDLHELPEGTQPSEVKDATLVSISRPNDTGGTDYYGLSADTEPAKAIIQAVAAATALKTTQVEAAEATLTFLFADRTTLLFGLYVEEDIIGRDGSYWQVDGDLSALVDAAVAIGQP